MPIGPRVYTESLPRVAQYLGERGGAQSGPLRSRRPRAAEARRPQTVAWPDLVPAGDLLPHR